MSHKLTTLQWGELRTAHAHLGEMLATTSVEVTDLEWKQLETIRLHLSQIVDPHPSPRLHPSSTLHP